VHPCDANAFLCDLCIFYGASKMMEIICIIAAIVLIGSVIYDARKDAKRIEENDKIRADFEEFMRTGNDRHWW